MQADRRPPFYVLKPDQGEPATDLIAEAKAARSAKPSRGPDERTDLPAPKPSFADHQAGFHSPSRGCAPPMTTTHPQAASDLRTLIQEAPYVDSFAINPDGGPDIVVEGGSRFVHESDFNAYKAWVTRFARAALDTQKAPPPAQDPVPALGLPAGEVEGLRALFRKQRDAAEDASRAADTQAFERWWAGAADSWHRAIEILNTHVLAPPASAADGEGLRYPTPSNCAERVMKILQDLLNNGPYDFDGVSTYAAANSAAIKIYEATGVLKDPTPPPAVPPIRVARQGRKVTRNVYLNDEPLFVAATPEEAARVVALLNAHAPGETPGQNAVEALHIVFDGPPGPEAGRFVEVETPDGKSVSVGSWHDRPDGFVELRLPALASLRSTQADTGGESQTPAPAGDAVEALARVIADELGMFWDDMLANGFSRDFTHDDLRRAARAALAAIAQGPGAGQAWQPIETAPRDDRTVLLGWYDGEEDPAISQWIVVNGWYEAGSADRCWYSMDDEPVPATHWMPEPPAPTPLATDGEG